MNKVAITPITEDQFKAAQATIALATAQGIQNASEHVAGGEPVTPPNQGSVNEDIKQVFRNKLEETINNPRFWAKESRPTTLMSAMSVPVFDDRSLHQYYIHSEADLKAKAATKSFETGAPAVLPTEEEIKAEAWKRWLADETKEVTKSLNKHRRDEAKRIGGKFIPVPPEEVKAIVDEAEAQLRASENC